VRVILFELARPASLPCFRAAQLAHVDVVHP
jgi:hypothetical protein